MKMLTVLFGLLLSLSSMAQPDEVRKKNFNIKKNLALEGYDAVSYFDKKPAEGDEKFSFTFKGVTYWFATQANLNRFKTSPEKYEPAYGGWCAYAMGETGEKVKIDPETYKIIDNK